MSRSRSISRSVPFVGVLLSLLAAPGLEAQSTATDAMAFPRQVLGWYLAGEADRVWEHAGEPLRALAESPQGIRDAAAEISATMGLETAVLGEQTFEHPEAEGWHVYVRTLRHARVAEMFWIVIFSPADREVQMIMPQPRQAVAAMFPQVSLP